MVWLRKVRWRNVKCLTLLVLMPPLLYVTVSLTKNVWSINERDIYERIVQTPLYNVPIAFNESRFLRQNCSDMLKQTSTTQTYMINRVSHLCKTCVELSKFHREESKMKAKSSTLFLYFPKIDMAYCKVPKAGSTFLAQMFKILEDDSVDLDNYIKLARPILHGNIERNHSRGRREAFNSIIVTRNPFTRLYSAYIDKVFMPLHFKTAMEMKQVDNDNQYGSKTGQCGGSASFESFLQFIVNEVKQNKTVNSHFAPITSFCNPCALNVYMLLRMEFFNDDIETFLNSLNIPASTHASIRDIMTSKHLEAILPGTIDQTIQFYRQTKSIQHCMEEIDIINIMWQTFQINGYIAQTFPFPRDAFVTGESQMNLTEIQQVFMDAAQKSNMTKEESKEQRKHFLVQSYRNISSDTLNDIIEIFNDDFVLLGYDVTPPNDLYV